MCEFCVLAYVPFAYLSVLSDNTVGLFGVVVVAVAGNVQCLYLVAHKVDRLG